MSELATRLRKFKFWLKHDFLTFDNVILLVAAGFCLAWTWGSISAMSRNWALAEEISARQREKAVLELEVETLELENEYYASAEYQELAARKYQGKLLPGETMVYLPDNSSLALSKDQNHQPATTAAVAERSNFAEWLKFLFGI